MRKMVRRILSPSMLVALLALFVALGGATYAAFKLPANSVGTKQLRNGAVTAAKVQKGSLLTSDFKSGQLPKDAGAATASLRTLGVPVVTDLNASAPTVNTVASIGGAFIVTVYNLAGTKIDQVFSLVCFPMSLMG